jgi:biotin-(acetyl-CoA carboxylase) ligase
VGIGVNTGSVPPEIEGIATSVQREAGLLGVRNRLVAEICNRFEEVYLDYTEKDGQREIVKDYQDRLFITGRQVLVTGPEAGSESGSCTATVLGIDETGALVVKDGRGYVKHISTGEIKLDLGDFT